ncbi:MAG: xanthine dehydrogenase family protein molybdopterin-binding subunit, partial [Pseudomonadota bacterium]
MAAAEPLNTGIGESVARVEDSRFLRGLGNYVDDIILPAQSYAAMVRSPHARATINGIDTASALASEGVLAVLTADDFSAFGGLPCGWQVHSKNGDPMTEPKHPILAEGAVRHVGDPVAVVVAETKAQARRAAGLVDVNYSELPAVVDLQAAAADGAELVHGDTPSNVCFDWELGDAAATDAAIAGAAHVTQLEL